MAIGAINVLVTLIALGLIDRIGRRPLLIGGVIVVDLAQAFLGGLYLLPQQTGVVGVLLVIGLCVYIAAFAASLGVGIWLLNAEVFPTAIRGKGSSLGVFTHWGARLRGLADRADARRAVTETGLFWIYGAFGVSGLVYLIRYLPETKGRTLEQVEDELRGR